MKTRHMLLLAALVAVVSLAAAQSPGRVVMGGKAVTMVADVVYAFPAARPWVVAVGGTDQGLGVFLSTVDPGFSALPPFDRQAGVEVYASYRPDLVILKSSLRSGLGAGLERIGIKTAYLSLESPEDFYADITTVGTIFGAPDRARELVGYYHGVVDSTERASKAALGKSGAGRPRVLMAQSVGDGFEVPPDSWIQTRLVELAGGTPVWKGANPGSGWTKVGPEQIAVWNPDVFIIISYKEKASAIAARTMSDPRFAGLQAAKNARIVGFPQDFLSWDQPDTRWGLGLLWLTETLFPGSMPGYSAEAEARRFFALFYGLGDAAFNAQVLPRMSGSGR